MATEEGHWHLGWRTGARGGVGHGDNHIFRGGSKVVGDAGTDLPDGSSRFQESRPWLLRRGGRKVFWLPQGGWRDSRRDWQRCLRGGEQTDLPWEGAFGFPESSPRLEDRAPLQAVSAPQMPSVVHWVPSASQGTMLLGRLSCLSMPVWFLHPAPKGCGSPTISHPGSGPHRCPVRGLHLWSLRPPQQQSWRHAKQQGILRKIQPESCPSLRLSTPQGTGCPPSGLAFGECIRVTRCTRLGARSLLGLDGHHELPFLSTHPARTQPTTPNCSPWPLP